ncbi:MAG: hypothetical protein Q7U47_15530 [Paludibacter sp.]|nr:hypothetical protein [Paludibacter sp.]
MPAANSTYKKLAVQWLNEVLFFVSSSVVADSLVLRNRHLRQASTVTNKPKKKKKDQYGHKLMHYFSLEEK